MASVLGFLSRCGSAKFSTDQILKHQYAISWRPRERHGSTLGSMRIESLKAARPTSISPYHGFYITSRRNKARRNRRSRVRGLPHLTAKRLVPLPHFCRRRRDLPDFCNFTSLALKICPRSKPVKCGCRHRSRCDHGEDTTNSGYLAHLQLRLILPHYDWLGRLQFVWFRAHFSYLCQTAPNRPHGKF
jgi:hypothetical protein